MKPKYPNKMNLPVKTIEKLWAKIKYPVDWKNHEDNTMICLEWDGPFDKYNRPKFHLNGKYVQAKRVMFESCFGEIGEEKVISNTCYNRNCVRPDHLQQNYFFIRETVARNGQKDPIDRRKKLRITVKEKDMLNVFNGLKEGWLKSIIEIGNFLNIDDSDAVEYLRNNKWQYINDYYTKEELDRLREAVGLSC